MVILFRGNRAKLREEVRARRPRRWRILHALWGAGDATAWEAISQGGKFPIEEKTRQIWILEFFEHYRAIVGWPTRSDNIISNTQSVINMRKYPHWTNNCSCKNTNFFRFKNCKKKESNFSGREISRRREDSTNLNTRIFRTLSSDCWMTN